MVEDFKFFSGVSHHAHVRVIFQVLTDVQLTKTYYIFRWNKYQQICFGDWNLIEDQILKRMHSGIY